jgi:hypothetical protein
VLRIFVSIEVELKDEKKKLKEFMNNRDVIDIFGQLLTTNTGYGNKEIMMLKARQTGKSQTSAALTDWRKTFDKYNRAQDRKETIKRLFNI